MRIPIAIRPLLVVLAVIGLHSLTAPETPNATPAAADTKKPAAKRAATPAGPTLPSTAEIIEMIEADDEFAKRLVIECPRRQRPTGRCEDLMRRGYIELALVIDQERSTLEDVRIEPTARMRGELYEYLEETTETIGVAIGRRVVSKVNRPPVAPDADNYAAGFQWSWQPVNDIGRSVGMSSSRADDDAASLSEGTVLLRLANEEWIFDSVRFDATKR